ncbi:dynactin subunit 3-like [Saccoglossus kowalevskii]|uniref:Dynactin subunit 3-like n=1 Tax=Saccoglossus kowalevskii TaxID=10224 RepID=A0ABM0H0W7_SACKO|nr:PREDICTED: dynactin subunit 3-like [Saccoglossus kowalevskii]
MAAHSVSQKLEQRIKILENRICGHEQRGFKTKDNKKCIDALSSFLQSMNTATAGRDNINSAWKRLQEIDQYLDPALSDTITMDDDLKTEIILAEEEHLKKQGELLEQVTKMKDILDSEHLKVTPNMSEKMQSLSHINMDQKEELESLNGDAKQLLEAYNHIITLLSKQFVQWDETVTQYEIASQKKPVDE